MVLVRPAKMASCDDNGPPSAKPADVDVALKKDGGDDTNGQSLPRSVSRSESRRPSRFSNVSNASTVNSSREGPQWSPSAAAADSVKRLDRTKSWGTRQAERLALESSDKDRGRDKDAVHVPLFSKLGYVLHFGEPIPEENLHLDDEAWVKKLLAKDHWWVIHPFSTFRRSWDFFLVALLLYVALMVPFVIGFEVRRGLPYETHTVHSDALHGPNPTSARASFSSFKTPRRVPRTSGRSAISRCFAGVSSRDRLGTCVAS